MLKCNYRYKWTVTKTLTLCQVRIWIKWIIFSYGFLLFILFRYLMPELLRNRKFDFPLYLSSLLYVSMLFPLIYLSVRFFVDLFGQIKSNMFDCNRKHEWKWITKCGQVLPWIVWTIFAYRYYFLLIFITLK